MPTESLLLDGAVGLVILSAGVGGWRRGGTALALHAAGLVAGLVAGLWLARTVSSALSPAAHVLLGVACAVGGLLVGGALGRSMGRAAGAGLAVVHLGLLDRAAGAMARAAGAALLCWLVLVVIAAVGPAHWGAVVRGAGIAGTPEGASAAGSTMGRWLWAPAGSLAAVVDATAPGDVAGLVPALGTSSTPLSTVQRIDAEAAGSSVQIAVERCGGSVVGSGFVIAHGARGDLVVTNAHVVRSSSSIDVLADGTSFTAVAVVYDRRADLALLRVAGLSVGALPLAHADAANGTRAVIVGYPHGGPRRAVGAVVEQRLPLPDPGLSDGIALHESYRLAADVVPGDSGSPLLTTDGHVIGVVNATAGARTGQGYAITQSELRPDLGLARGRYSGVDTGGCR